MENDKIFKIRKRTTFHITDFISKLFFRLNSEEKFKQKHASKHILAELNSVCWVGHCFTFVQILHVQ